MNTLVRLILLPGEIWSEPHMAAVVSDALVCERRIRKGSNLEVEQARYGLNSTFIESRARAYQRLTLAEPVVTLDSQYLAALAKLQAHASHDSYLQSLAIDARLGATFFPPSQILRHLEAWSALMERSGFLTDPALERRLEALKGVYSTSSNGAYGYGLVEVHEPFVREPIRLEPMAIAEADKPNRVMPRSRSSTRQYEIDSPVVALRAAINEALATNAPVNFGNPPHNVITEVLHEHVYAQNGRQPCLIRVLYGDGSEAKPFPLFCLSARPPKFVMGVQGLPPLRTALLSMRHLDQDAQVDIAWLLNQQVSRPRAFAETDQFCYERTLAQLDRLRTPVHLRLHQTGLQPAVVGFYRALVEWLGNQPPPSAIVVPYYYRRGGGYTDGQIWA